MKTWKTPKGTELPILDMRGKDYLEVKWRLVWFREERPTWSVETEFLSITDKDAFCKATVRDEAGRVIATGHKYEDVRGFADYREKCETGSIGRALALIGYGTQFCADELDEGKRLADAPVTQKGAITVDQPGEKDGNTTPSTYKKSFGKWSGKTPAQIYREEPLEVITGYMDWLHDDSLKKKVPMTAPAAEFIREMETYIGSVENGKIDPPGGA